MLKNGHEFWALAGIVLFLAILFFSQESPSLPIIISNEGFSVVEVKIEGDNLTLTGNCRSVTMTVSEHQALSIDIGLRDEFYVRPLTHDIINDILKDYGIKLLAARIDSFTSGIYTAKIFLQQGTKTLEIDTRPTDAIGIAIRQKLPVYFRTDLLEVNGEKAC